MQKITSAQHPLVKHLVKLRQNKDYREEHHHVVIEGNKMVKEIGTQVKARSILLCHPELLPPNVVADQVFLTSEEIIHKITGTVNPEGIVAEVPLPPYSSLEGLSPILALDHVADPGNVGSLFRSALALGWQGLFILEGGCDPFNPKVLRASMGAVFRLPLRIGNWHDLRQLVQESALKPMAADLSGTPIQEIDQDRERLLLVLGSESHGLSSEAQSLCQKVTIPMKGEVDSLNVAVAGAILMYQLKRVSQ